jgi:hypothetical protein
MTSIVVRVVFLGAASGVVWRAGSNWLLSLGGPPAIFGCLSLTVTRNSDRGSILANPDGEGQGYPIDPFACQIAPVDEVAVDIFSRTVA